VETHISPAASKPMLRVQLLMTPEPILILLVTAANAAIGTIAWRYLSVIFYWVTDVIGIERWEGTIEYTLMAPIQRVTHMLGQTSFAVVYSMFHTIVILGATLLFFNITLANANLITPFVVLLAGSFSFIGFSIVTDSGWASPNSIYDH
jgi:hypothetical protein